MRAVRVKVVSSLPVFNPSFRRARHNQNWSHASNEERKKRGRYGGGGGGPQWTADAGLRQHPARQSRTLGGPGRWGGFSPPPPPPPTSPATDQDRRAVLAHPPLPPPKPPRRPLLLGSPFPRRQQRPTGPGFSLYIQRRLQGLAPDGRPSSGRCSNVYPPYTGLTSRTSVVLTRELGSANTGIQSVPHVVKISISR